MGASPPDWLWPGLLALTAGLVYLPGGAVWDDHTLILAHLVHLDGSELLGLWSAPVGGGEVGQGYYRPVATTALALLGRLGVPAIHALALLLHCASAVLLARALGGRSGALAAGLFAVHPLGSEVLGWASALPDALAVCLGLAAVLVSRRSLPAALLLGLLAALSKELGLVFLPLAALGGLAPRRAGLAGVGLIGAVLALRAVLGVGASWSVADRLELVPAALAWPLSSLLLPWPLTAVRDLLAVPGWVLPVGGLVLLLLAGGAARARAPRQALAGMLLVLLGPVLALPPTLDGYLAAERYAYLSLAGLAVWLHAVAGPLLDPGDRRVRAGGGLALVVALGLHLGTGPRWWSDTALFGSATRALPESSYAWHFLGVVSAQAGDLEAAEQAFARAVETGHPHPDDVGLRLRALVSLGRHEEALAWMATHAPEELDAAEVAWWARAAAGSGQAGRARELLRLLRVEGGWDGPEWVGELAVELGLEAPSPTPGRP